MERLNPLDMMMLWPDEVGWPQDLGALAILDGRTLVDAEGRFRIEGARAAIESRLEGVPRFRQVLAFLRRGLGLPVWVDSPTFDIGEHVGVFPVSPPGDEAQLLMATEQLRRRPLERSRPLWQMWFLPGLSEGRVGLYMKVHHVMADGPAGVALLGAFLDPVTGVSSAPPRPWTPRPAPSARELLEDNLRERFQALRRTLATLSRPGTVVRGARDAWKVMREMAAAEPTSRSSLNRPIGPDRTFALVRSHLAFVKEIAHRCGVKVNDVLLTAIAGGLRELLRSRGEAVDALVFRAFVPVSIHGDERGGPQGNRIAEMAVPLHVGQADPIRRMRLIAGETARGKSKPLPHPGELIRSRTLQRASLVLMARQRTANTYVANVPGPQMPLYFAGAPLLEVFPIVPLIWNVTLGVGAFSYAGQFNVTAVGDRALCPDIEVFAQGVRDALQAIAAAQRPVDTGAPQS
jgi:diacylglycerol O-acyltransferase